LVHAHRDGSFLLDFGVGGLAPTGAVEPLDGQEPGAEARRQRGLRRIYLDIGDPGGASVRAPCLTMADAYRRYG
jgi:hypothetical protein